MQQNSARPMPFSGDCRYRDDPTIMAWDLINEPRCYKCGNSIQVFSSYAAMATCLACPGKVNWGRAGQGRAGQGRAGQGRAGRGRAGRGGAERAGRGRAGGPGQCGRAGAGQGRAGQGKGRAGGAGVVLCLMQ